MKDAVTNCIRIGIDCVKNDSVDIRIGGPQYLGFDFCVRKQEYDEMVEFIKQELAKNEIPILKIYDNGKYNIDEAKIWPKEKIAKCIENESAYLKMEAGRSHSLK